MKIKKTLILMFVSVLAFSFSGCREKEEKFDKEQIINSAAELFGNAKQINGEVSVNGNPTPQK